MDISELPSPKGGGLLARMDKNRGAHLHCETEELARELCAFLNLHGIDCSVAWN